MKEANAAEPLRFWGGGEVQGRCVLGAAVRQACPTADDLGEALSAYDGEAFAVTYRRVLQLLRASSDALACKRWHSNASRSERCHPLHGS